MVLLLDIWPSQILLFINYYYMFSEFKHMCDVNIRVLHVSSIPAEYFINVAYRYACMQVCHTICMTPSPDQNIRPDVSKGINNKNATWHAVRICVCLGMQASQSAN